MAIILFTGTTGSGKSYGCMENVILQALEKGRPIVTNIPLKKAHLTVYCEDKGWPSPSITLLDNDKLSDIKSNPAYLLSFDYGSVFVIDEVWEWWPSGQRVSAVQHEHLEFFKMHRHRVGDNGYTDEIVLITQDSIDIAAWLKRLIKETYHAVKLDHVGQPNSYRVDVLSNCPGSGKKVQKIRSLFGKYKPEVYNLYHSHTQKQSDNWGAGKEEKPDKRANLLRSPAIRYVLPASIALFFISIYFSIQTFHKLTEPKANEAIAPVKQTQKQLEPPPLPPKAIPADMQIDTSSHQPPIPSAPLHQVKAASTGPSPSTTWRIAAVIENRKGKVVYLVGRAGFRQIADDACETPPGITQLQCIVDGQLVSYWTGQNMSGFGNTSLENVAN